MNRYIHKLATVIVTLSTLTYTACDTDAEGELYIPQGVEAGFITPSLSLELDNKGEFTVEVNRGNLEGEASVKLSLQDESGFFSLESESVTFDAGKNSALATIKYDFEDLEPAVTYDIALGIASEDQMSQNAYATKEISLEKKLTWNSIGVGTYYSHIFGESWPQEILQAEEAPNTYRLPDCISMGYSISLTLDDNGDLDGFQTQPTGYTYGSYGMTYFILNNSQPAVREENKLQIPLYLAVKLDGGWGTIDMQYEIIEFPAE